MRNNKTKAFKTTTFLHNELPISRPDENSQMVNFLIRRKCRFVGSGGKNFLQGALYCFLKSFKLEPIKNDMYSEY